MTATLDALPIDLWLADLSEDNFDFIRRLVYEHSRIHLGPEKKVLVTARLAKRLRALKLPDYSAYCRHLKSSRGADELPELLDVISTNHTHFFRESRHFEFLREVALPQWRARGPSGTFRVWSAACSSGEEAYTLAIVLAENLGLATPWQVFATDLSNRMLKAAREGIYPADRLTHVVAEKRARYFQRGTDDWEGQYRVKQELRDRVEFSRLNLLQPGYPFSTKFDAIFCRNVMIYFDRDTQEALVQKVAQHLQPNGYLMVGHSESLSGISHPLSAIQPALYQKR